MDKPSVKLSSHFTLTACLSAGITIVLSLAYILLCTAALIFRHNCSYGLVTSANGAEYFWKTIFSAYILINECEASQAALDMVKNDITGEHAVFVLTTTTLSASILCLITAICVISVAQDEGAPRYTNLVIFAYIGSCFVSLVVDVTAATHYGMDYSYLTSILEKIMAGDESNYKLDVLRQGAFWMMTISLKGYAAHVFNLILLILMMVYVAEYRQQVKNNEHSIHKLGILPAYDSQPRKPEDNWSTTQPDSFLTFTRGPQMSNNGFSNEDVSPPRTPRRNPSQRKDYNSNRPYERTDTWNLQPSNAAHNSRPFSYLEEIKRPIPTRPPVSPAVETPWRRDPWPPAPPVPAPDYSPIGARRLKSALKPTYM